MEWRSERDWRFVSGLRYLLSALGLQLGNGILLVSAHSDRLDSRPEQKYQIAINIAKDIHRSLSSN